MVSRSRDAVGLSSPTRMPVTSGVWTGNLGVAHRGLTKTSDYFDRLPCEGPSHQLGDRAADAVAVVLQRPQTAKRGTANQPKIWHTPHRPEPPRAVPSLRGYRQN